jgi:hypothetical protein
MFRIPGTATAVLLLAFGNTGCCAPVSAPAQAAQSPLQSRYFPSSEFTNQAYDSVLVPSFEKHLTDLSEPVLYGRPGVHYAVRVTWLTPFYGDAVLRIEDDGNIVGFTYKRRPTVAALDTKKNIDLNGEIPRPAFAKLTSEIQQKDFFSLSNEQNVIATDGTIWLLEVYDGGRYHAAYRIGPFSTPVQNLGRLAAAMAHITVKDLE